MKKLISLIPLFFFASVVFAQIGQKYVVKVQGVIKTYSKTQIDSIFALSNTHLNAGTGTTITGSGTTADPYVINAAVQSVAGKTGVVTLGKADVGLSNVDNTSDISKPISTATQNALNLKANDNAVMHTNTTNETGSNKWMNASYIALPGEINDMGMTGLFDRNELTIIDKRGGTITTTITGGGSDAGIVSPLVDATGQFYSIGSGTSSTSLTINIDMGTLMPNYSSAYWQPFVMFRGSFSYFKNITVEVSNDNITWYKPATGWDFSYDATGFFPNWTWIGTRAIPTGLPSYLWRYARFTMTNPIMYLGTNMYITEIGIRHVSAPYARQYIRADGADMYGDYQLKNTADAVGDFLTRNSSTGKITRRTAAETLSDIGALSSSLAASTYEPIITSAKVLPNGVTATTQGTSDSSNKLSTTAFFKSATIKANQITTGTVDKARLPITNIYTRYPAVSVNDSTVGISQTWIDSMIALIGTGSGMPSLQNRNYANDSLAVLIGGLNLWDYYRNGSDVKIVSKLPQFGSSDFNVVYNKKSGTKQSDSVIIRIDSYSGANSFNVSVDWGDGGTDNYTGGYDYTMKHKYVADGLYNAVFTVSDYTKPKEIYFKASASGIDTTNFSRINNLKKFTALASFKIQTPSTGENIIDTLTYPSTVATIEFYQLNIKTFNPTTFPSSLTSLSVKNTAGLSFSPTSLPAGLTSLTLTSNYWTSSGVNDVLAYMVLQTFNAGAKTLNLQQYQGATPTGQGVADEATLESGGWTVNTD